MSAEIINIQPEVYKRGGVYNQKTILKTHTEKIYACNKTDLTDSNNTSFPYKFDFPKNCIPSTARLVARVRACLSTTEVDLDGTTEKFVATTATTHVAFKNGVLNNLFATETIRDASSQEVSNLSSRDYTKALAHLKYLLMSEKETKLMGIASGFYSETNDSVATTLNASFETLNNLAGAAKLASPATFIGRPLSPFFENNDVLWFPFQFEMSRAANSEIVYNGGSATNPIKPIITQLYFLVDVVDQSSVKEPTKPVWYPLKNYNVEYEALVAGEKSYSRRIDTTQRPHKVYMLMWRDAKHVIMNHDSHPNGLTNIRVVYTSKTNGTDTYSPSSEGYTVTTTSGAWTRGQDNAVRAYYETMEANNMLEKNSFDLDRYLATFRGDWFLCFDVSPDRLGYPTIVKEDGALRIEGTFDVNCAAAHVVFVVEYDTFYQVDGAGKIKKLM